MEHDKAHQQDADNLETPTELHVHHGAQGEKRMRVVYIILGCISLGVVITLLLFGIQRTPKAQSAAPIDVEPVDNPFDEVSLVASSAVVYDIKHDTILFEKMPDTVLPLASITKLVSAYAAIEHAPDFLQVTIAPEDTQLEGDQGLRPGEIWRLDDLISFSLVTSSNDGMSAVAQNIGRHLTRTPDYETNKKTFINVMNTSMDELGLTETRFKNETGLDKSDLTSSGGYGTARDIAHIVGILVESYPGLVEDTRDSDISVTSLSGFPHTGENTNLSTAALPGLLMSKTGYTDLAGGNLAIAFDGGLGRPIAVVVLGSTLADRFTDVETLVEAARTYVKHHPARATSTPAQQ